MFHGFLDGFDYDLHGRTWISLDVWLFALAGTALDAIVVYTSVLLFVTKRKCSLVVGR
jgi:hypothetical protein